MNRILEAEEEERENMRIAFSTLCSSKADSLFFSLL